MIYTDQSQIIYSYLHSSTTYHTHLHLHGSTTDHAQYHSRRSTTDHRHQHIYKLVFSSWCKQLFFPQVQTIDIAHGKDVLEDEIERKLVEKRHDVILMQIHPGVANIFSLQTTVTRDIFSL